MSDGPISLPGKPDRGSWSVGAYLLVAFAVTLSALTGLMAFTTSASFGRERDRVSMALQGAARSALEAMETSDAQTVEFLPQMATTPGLASLERERCLSAFDAFGALLASSGTVQVLRPDRSVVCSVGQPQEIALGPWFDEVAGGQETLTLPPERDDKGRVTQLIATPIPGSGGGVMAIVLTVGAYSQLHKPAGLPDETVLVALDADRSFVVARTPANDFVGRLVDGSGLGRPVGPDGATLADLDGQKRVYYEMSSTDGARHVLAGLPPSVAWAAARRQLAQTLALGAFTVVVVGFLGFLLHRRIARPVRRLTRSVRAAEHDSATWATVAGPAEIAELAGAFNQMLAGQRSQEADLRHRATHDMLTGLPNRARVTEEIVTAVAADGPTAVLFLDLDRFKHVNDSHGHSVGDELLVALSGRLRAAVRPDCLVARFGGDEFVVVAPCAEGPAVAMAQRLIRALTDPFELGSHRLYVTGSVGVVIARPGDSAEDLLRYADTAMYKAKDNGRAGFAVFDDDLRAWSAVQLQIESDLHYALERDEFVLHYQPKFALATGSLTGLEVLVRWQHPERGLVPPGEFIPVAEDSGAIEPLGGWVLETACEQAAAWRDQGLASVPIAVNIAPRQLTRPDFVAFVAGVLGRTGVEAPDLTLEITESAVLQDPLGAADQLRRLRQLGLRLSLDDFGTGYSSLSHLQHFPVDEVKIDRSFVARLSDSETSQAIVGSLIQLSHALGLSVVAEGVETEDQADALRRLGCEMAQGFLLGRPVPADEVAALLPAHPNFDPTTVPGPPPQA